MIRSVIVHLVNELPLLVDLFELPGSADRSVRCTNVRMIDGKRPSFVHDPRATFIFPFSVIRMIEAPAGQVTDTTLVPVDYADPADFPHQPDEESEEDLLARIRST